MAERRPTQTIATASGIVLTVTTRADEDLIDVLVERKSGPPCVLHWGLVRAGATAWQAPPESALPPGSRGGQHAACTPLAAPTDALALRLRPAWGFRFLALALFDPKTSAWDNNQGKNYRIVLPAPPSPVSDLPGDARLGELAARIIEHETGPGSWTLMHRFNLAWELLDEIPDGSAPGLALLFVWLRFSALRQLDWQRRYNTQPRDLAHAQDRLTRKLAERAAREIGQRPLLRMLAGTLGRGGDGQRVRDAILEIMHRHHIKEVAGHFLEEWHQKLHNNSTPDDVLICEAYLEFLRQHGDAAVFYRVLEAGGVTRQRLESYERPIRSEPWYVPSLRDAFLHDFGELLGVLRSVHSATDFGVALAAARGWLDEPTRELLDAVWRRHTDAHAATWLLDAITRARETLGEELRPGRDGLRDLLYLDLGLEELARTVSERLRDAAAARRLRLSVHAALASDPAREAGRARLARDIELARDAGARVVNIHFAADDRDAFGRTVLALADQLEPMGITLAVENTVSTGPEDINWLFARLPALDPRRARDIGLCLDIGHANLYCGTHNDYLGFLDRLGPHVPIVHAHLHENWGDADRHLPLFTGPAGRDLSGIAGLLARLRRRGFHGSLILEQWPQPPALLVEARDRLRALGQISG